MLTQFTNMVTGTVWLLLAALVALVARLPYRDPLLGPAFGVVGFSVIVQGITVPLLRRLSLMPADH